MKKLSIAFVLFCSMYVLSAVNTQAQALYFNIINKTGFTLNTFQVTPSETTTWGEDILPNDFLENNKQIRVDIPETYGNTCFFDVRITDLEGTAVIYYAIDACKLLNLTIYADGTATVENE
jgi:hypothetical protein